MMPIRDLNGAMMIDGRVLGLEGRALEGRGADDAATRRVLSLLEDAVRAASSSGALPGRVVVIRQLDVNAILAPAATPAQVGPAVDAAAQRLIAAAADADQPGAASAPLVYFRDDSAAVLSLARRVASGRPAAEWFWPSVVKGWTAGTPPDRAIPLLIGQALSSGGGVVTLAHVVETLAATGALDRLLAPMTEAEGRALLRAIGWAESTIGGRSGAEPAAEPPTAEPAAAAPHMPPGAQRFVGRWVDRWNGGARDPRALWLGALLLVADRPARLVDADLPALARAWLASIVEHAAADGAGAGAGAGGNPVTDASIRGEDLIADARAWLQTHPRSPLDLLFGGGPPFPIAPRQPMPDAPRIERGDGEHENESENEGDDDGESQPRHTAGARASHTDATPQPTDHAGFLFVVPLLARVGVGALAANDPGLTERRWPAALILRLARRLGIPRRDPAIAWIAAPPAAIHDVDRALTAEILRAARVRLRFEANLTLRRLVDRGGAVAVSPARVDVLLHRAADDADVRRAGLDADPAPAPWLGRDVAFHYLDGMDLTA